MPWKDLCFDEALDPMKCKDPFFAIHTMDEGCAKLEEARFGGSFFSFLFRIIPFADFWSSSPVVNLVKLSTSLMLM